MEIRERLQSVRVRYRRGSRYVRCFCGKTSKRSILDHLRKSHPKELNDLSREFIRLRNNGLSAKQIISNFKINDRPLFTWKVVDSEIKRIVEEGKATILPATTAVTEWKPRDFHQERTTVWDFPNRGSWAVHRGDFRGNWSPRIARNLILKYTKRNDIVLDPFVGGGTTVIEAWLLRRRSVGLDVSPYSIKHTLATLKGLKHSDGTPSQLDIRCKPKIGMGDARKLRDKMHGFGITDESIALACLHPPYLNTLKYSANIMEDLSRIRNPYEFCKEMRTVAREVYSVLRRQGKCALLIGDVRRQGKLIPLGWMVMNEFCLENFELTHNVIKVQHNDRSNQFWATSKNIDLLIAHEYLFIFSKL